MPRKKNYWLIGIAGIVYLFLYLPLFIVIVYSFNDSKFNAEWVGFTFNWYKVLFNNQKMLMAAGNSLLIALVSSFFATLLGTFAGVALHRYKMPFLSTLVIAPMAIPELLMGVSLVIFFVIVNELIGLLELGLMTVIIAHIGFCMGFVAIVVRARMAGMDDSLVEAARDLGASPLKAFRLVTLPQIMPGIIAGALMSFTLSIDDFVITFFTAGAGVSTLPLEIYSKIKVAVTPEVNAVSSLLMLLTLLLAVIAMRVSPSAFRANH